MYMTEKSKEDGYSIKWVTYMAEKRMVQTSAVCNSCPVRMVLVLGAILFMLLGKAHHPDVTPQYAGARIEGDVVTLEFMKNQKCLHKYAFQIVLKTREILMALPSLVDVNVPNGKHFTVCGDAHGQFFDLLYIFELNGLPSDENPYLFNGDFVDWGSFSVEVILTLFCVQVYVSISKSMNKIYGFDKVKCMLSDKFVELFAEGFCYLPLAHVVSEKIFVVHGGLFSTDGVKLSQTKVIDRFCEPPEGIGIGTCTSYLHVKRISPNDPYASKKLMECEKAVIKHKFKEANAIPTTERCSISESIDLHTIGIAL
ncbi:hypothetical protein L6452_13763 [Arctium lappa]|uniref:Uncharacterized protein n=1 Tax=Arctium lappa TaxID=4217 RepID=A0ACB9CJG7_ARCLA|nr:hypothetical protein L6452_13763 [Arctium lappa]